MRVRIRLLACVLFVALPCLAAAQTHGYVSLADEGLYALVDALQARGVVDAQSTARPFTTSWTLQLLRTALESERSTLAERATIGTYLARYQPRLTYRFDGIAASTINLDAANPAQPHAINGAGLFFGGNAFPWLSLQAEFSMLLDLVNTGAFLPNAFTKTWDHHHIGSEDRSASATEELSFSNRTENDIVASTPDGLDYLRFGRYRRDWGPGIDSLLLAGSARPFDALEAGVALGNFGYFSWLAGSLGGTGSASTTASEQKMLSAHRLTLTPFPWLSVGFWESIVWGKRLELSYLTPVGIYLVSQMATAGDMDNSTMGFDLELKLPPLGSWYGSVFIDEIDHTRLTELFSFPKNMFAFYTGFKLPVPLLPFGLARLQYTKLEPFVYTHYPQDYPFFDATRVNINYTHDGENLGYPLPPNSDQFLAVLTFLPTPGLNVELKASYVRHGDNPGATNAIMGDIDEDIVYREFRLYPEKDFLHDGIYERILSVSGTLGYSLPALGLRLSAGYGFSWSRNAGNVEGVTEYRHVFSLGGRYALPVWSR